MTRVRLAIRLAWAALRGRTVSFEVNTPVDHYWGVGVIDGGIDTFSRIVSGDWGTTPPGDVWRDR